MSACSTFPDYASYTDATEDNAARAMAPHEYANWLLGNFATVEEVKANFDKVVLVPVVVEAIEQVAPVHFVVHDRSGKSVVIEPLNKSLKIYDNPLGVVTNSPTFDWHMTNLRNYVNLTATNVPPINLGGVKLAQFGQGSGLRGLPGDFTPPVPLRARGRVLAIRRPPSATAAQAVLQAFHILNNFDIPLRRGARGRQRPDARRSHHLDQRLRSEEPALVLPDLRRPIDPPRRSGQGARRGARQDQVHQDASAAAGERRFDRFQMSRPHRLHVKRAHIAASCSQETNKTINEFSVGE